MPRAILSPSISKISDAPIARTKAPTSLYFPRLRYYSRLARARASESLKNLSLSLRLCGPIKEECERSDSEKTSERYGKARERGRTGRNKRGRLYALFFGCSVGGEKFRFLVGRIGSMLEFLRLQEGFVGS